MTRDLTTWTGAAPPTPCIATGRFIAIEAYQPAHLAALWEGLGGMATNQLLRYFAQDDFAGVAQMGAWLAAQTSWIPHVLRDRATNAIVGMASYMRVDVVNGSIEIGAVAHGPGLARSPGATEAHYLFAKHVFEALGYRRYEWKCHDQNAASRAAARRYGFTYEGTFRNHMVSKHANRDTAWFAMIDDEWPQIARAFERWLAPDNFDADGVQRARLESFR